MAKYSDWRSDLREVMDDDVDEKKVTGKGVNNNKLIKINPKLGEAVEQIGGQILEVTEVDTVDGEEEEDKSKKFEKEKQDKIADKNKKKEMMLKKRIVRMKMMAVNQGAGDSLVAHHEPEGEVLDERLGGRGYSRSAMKSSIHPPSRKSTGDWEDSDRGKGNKARRRAGEKVEKKSPTYRAYVLNKEEKECKGRHPRDQKELDRAEAFIKKNPNFGKKVNEGVMKFIKDRVGGKKKEEKKPEKAMDAGARGRRLLKRREHIRYVSDIIPDHLKDEFTPIDEAVKGQDTEMRKVKAAERKAGTDPKNTEDPTGKNYAKGQRASVSWWKNKTKVQKEEVVTELNRYGKETGKATGSLNKRPGSPVATRNEPNSAINFVRRNIIRPQTGRPEGQRKKVKGEKGRVQPGDRKFTPAQTISRMRAQVAAADAAMRDTRGT